MTLFPPEGEKTLQIQITHETKNAKTLDPMIDVRTALALLFDKINAQYFPGGRATLTIRTQESEAKLRKELQELLPDSLIEVQKM